ncbi:class I SAM-dependent methyltransferase [[Kitasatospora] papulosa]|uniref:class I SAM-dependent methyltransferase n=1 Tax=[Kitasatospora] papulosa TaxID=1464011 RepID=UPI0036739816
MTVIGASDGRLVVPLAAAGYRVIAIERDPLALHGGEVQLPGNRTGHAMGMIERLKQEGLHDRVQVVEDDFLSSDPVTAPCDAVWTSCSWHYSANHHRPLGEFVDRMQRLVRPGGLFGAEFMMPLTQRHHVLEHYTSPEKLRRYFIGDWEVLLTLRTNEFTE